MIPNRKLYDRIKEVVDNDELIDSHLVQWLSTRNLKGFKHRLRSFVKFVDGEIKSYGKDKVFEMPDLEDWKTRLSRPNKLVESC